MLWLLPVSYGMQKESSCKHVDMIPSQAWLMVSFLSSPTSFLDIAETVSLKSKNPQSLTMKDSMLLFFLDEDYRFKF